MPDGEGALVVAQGAGTACNLVTGALDEVAVPVIFAIGGIYSLSVVPGVGQRQRRREVLQQKVALLVVRADAPGLRATFCLAHHLRLDLTRLHLLFHLVKRGTHEELVSPPLVGESHLQLADGRQIVVVEASAVDGDIFTALLIPDLHAPHHVVVL